MDAEFTVEQLSQWRAYERVRKSGRFNMFDQNAVRLTGLSAKEYAFVMRNYSELKDAVSKKHRP